MSNQIWYILFIFLLLSCWSFLTTDYDTRVIIWFQRSLDMWPLGWYAGQHLAIRQTRESRPVMLSHWLLMYGCWWYITCIPLSEVLLRSFHFLGRIFGQHTLSQSSVCATYITFYCNIEDCVGFCLHFFLAWKTISMMTLPWWTALNIKETAQTL